MRQRKSLQFAVALVVLCPLPCLAAQEKSIAILHARLIDGLGGPRVDDSVVILQGNKVEYAGPAKAAKVPQGSQISDGRGNTVMTGRGDMHVHVRGGWDGISLAL